MRNVRWLQIPVLFPLALSVGVLLAAAPAGAANLLTNPQFDTSIAGWMPLYLHVTWSPSDAGGFAGSGSAHAEIYAPAGAYSSIVLSQCVAVTAGTTYDVGFRALLPAGQALTASAAGLIYYFDRPGCPPDEVMGPGTDSLPSVTETGAWEDSGGTFTAPAESVSASFMFAIENNGSNGDFEANFDDAYFCPTGTCEDSGIEGAFFTDPQYPDFRFRVNIGEPGAVIPGTHEEDCQPDTVCVSGALPGRSELFVRILGPRPNGYLWPTLVRFTPSRVAVEIEQVSTGVDRVYVLDAVPPGTDDLPGLQDRMGFVP